VPTFADTSVAIAAQGRHVRLGPKPDLTAQKSNTLYPTAETTSEEIEPSFVAVRAKPDLRTAERNRFTLAMEQRQIWSERDLRFYGIRDEALCFDAFHDFRARSSSGFGSEAYRGRTINSLIAVPAFDIFEGQAFGYFIYRAGVQDPSLASDEEGQHHACIE